MKHKIFVAFCVLCCVFNIKVQAQGDVTVSLAPGRTFKTDIQLKSSSGNGATINAELSMAYDMSSRELTVCVMPKSGMFDKLFFPTKSYMREDLKSAVARDLKGKYKAKRPFRREITFGIGPALQAKGATNAETGNVGMAQEMYKAGETFVTHLRVNDPEKMIEIKLSGISAVQMLESASGKMKYRFMCVFDDKVMKVTVPVDPCKDERVVKILADAQKLYDEAQATHIDLTKAAGSREKTKCEDCKKQFEKYSDSFKDLKRRYETNGAKCAVVDLQLRQIEITIHDADTIKCSKGPIPPIPGKDRRDKKKGEGVVVPPPPSDCAGVVKALNDGVKKLENYFNKIAGGGSDAVAAKSEALTKILELDERVSHLDEKCKNRAETRSAINSYENVKKMINTKVGSK